MTAEGARGVGAKPAVDGDGTAEATVAGERAVHADHEGAGILVLELTFGRSERDRVVRGAGAETAIGAVLTDAEVEALDGAAQVKGAAVDVDVVHAG